MADTLVGYMLVDGVLAVSVLVDGALVQLGQSLLCPPQGEDLEGAQTPCRARARQNRLPPGLRFICLP